ncbi:hypothetical protein BKA65DRAFT_542470 [Rhexocercosporidium sp. MPI-PUGE-AT-0058]|nr:hypothetical protein BKA65DRAFT_542470 [Rhexocercosporidium sp. MPI-PUGE-AT-0058]
MAQASDVPNTGIENSQPNLPFDYKSRTLTIDFSTEDLAKASNGILQQYETSFPASQFAPSSVTIKGSCPIANLTLLTSFFLASASHNARFESVHWTSRFPIPRTIISALEAQASVYHPAPRLYYTIDFWHQYNESEEESARIHEQRLSVLASESMYALIVKITYTEKMNLRDLDFVYKILRTCRELRVLELELEHVGCVYGGATPYAFPFRVVPTRAGVGGNDHDIGIDVGDGDGLTAEWLRQYGVVPNEKWRFPPLSKLKLSGYDLQENSDGGYAWYWRDYSNYSQEWDDWALLEDEETEPPARPVRMEDDGVTSLEMWLRVMDWSELGILDLSNPSGETLRLLGGKGVLPGLEHLALRGGEGTDVLGFLSGMACERGCLKSLELRGVQFGWNKKVEMSLIEILVTKHPGLKRFSVGDGKANGQFFSTDSLSNLTHILPLLESIDVDIPRPQVGDDGNWGWNWDILDPFLKVTNLKEMTIRFPSPDSILARQGGIAIGGMYSQIRIQYHEGGDEVDEIDPIVNRETLEALFGELRRRKRSVMEEGTELENLVVYVGDWDGRYERGLLLSDNALFRVSLWECSVNEDDLEVCEGKQTRVVD